jgi:hypothetical protein
LCVPCKISYSEINSGNEKIDSFIQEMQLKFDSSLCIVFEWIPYSSQFSEINEIGNDAFVRVYSAIWEDGPLCYSSDVKKYTRDQNKRVSLKCIYNSKHFIDEFLSKV